MYVQWHVQQDAWQKSFISVSKQHIFYCNGVYCTMEQTACSTLPFFLESPLETTMGLFIHTNIQHLPFRIPQLLDIMMIAVLIQIGYWEESKHLSLGCVLARQAC